MIELIWMEIDTADYQCTMAWPHHTDTATAPLATSMMTCRLQDHCPGFSVLFQASGYVVEDCQHVADVSARRLRSADTATCVTRRTSNIFGDRCIAAAGPWLWNTLVVHLRQCHSLEQLKHLLKTFLFSAWGHGTLQHLLKVAPYINLLTYLSGLQVKGKCEWSTWGWGGQSEVGFGGFELNRLSVWILS